MALSATEKKEIETLVRKEIKELVVRMFTEFYGLMYQQRTQWQSRLRNA